MPKWLEKYSMKEAKKAGLKPGTSKFNAYKYTVIRKVEKKTKVK